ncbi:MAG: hypothetical protein ACTSSK_05320 [Candidatus Heimdallarchaeota archaeon]
MMIGKKKLYVLTLIMLFVANSCIIAMELPTIVGQVDEDTNNFFDVNTSTVNFTNAGVWNENLWYVLDVEYYNDSLYVLGAANGILKFDISDPENIQKQDFCRVGTNVQHFDIDHGVIYLADETDGLILLNTTTLSVIGTKDLGFSAYDVCYDEETAFVACGTNGMVVVNVSNPSSLSIIDTKSGAMYDVQRITISDHIAYLSMNNHGFTIFNVTDPNDIVVWVEEYDLTTVNHIEVFDETFYVARDSGIEIFNHSSEGSPAPKGTYSGGEDYLETCINENILFIADGRNGVDILNVTNENTPGFVANIEAPFDGWIWSITFKDNYIYIVDAPNGLKVYNVTDASNPIKVLEYGIVGYAFDLTVDDDVAYISNGNITLSTVDVADSNNPFGLGQWDGYTFTTQIEYYGGYIFVLDMLGILVFDVTDPSNPELHMNITGSSFAQKFYVYNNTLYILYEDELEIWFTHNPLSYDYVSTTEITATFLRDIIVINETIYILDSDDVIHVLDSTNYYSLEEIGTYTCRGNSYDFYYYSDLLFINCYEFLEVVDISQSAIPTYAANYTGYSEYHVEDISIQDGLLYVALGFCLKVLDVRSAYYIKQVGSLDTKSEEHFYGVEVYDDTVYLATGFGGLRIATIDSDLEPVPTTTPPTIQIPGFTLLAFTTSITFLGILVVIKRRRN